MPKSGKAAKRTPAIAGVIAANTRALFAYAEDHLEKMEDLSTPVRLEAYIKDQKWGDSVGKSHIYRMRKPKGGCVGADVVDLVARAYGFQAWQLLVPGFDPANPPLIRTDRELQDEVARRLRKALEPFAAMIGGLSGEARPDGSSAAFPFGDLKTPAAEPRGAAAAGETKARPKPRKKTAGQR